MMKTLAKRALVFASASALVAGAVAVATPAQAARGDQRTFSMAELGFPNHTVEDAAAGVNGSIYTTIFNVQTGSSFLVLSPTGTALRSGVMSLQGDQLGTAVTADGVMYVCQEGPRPGEMLRIDQDGNQTIVSSRLTGYCRQPVRGLDGNVWFGGTVNAATGEVGIGRVNSAGQVEMFGTRLVNPDPGNKPDPYLTALTPGATGSGLMYFSVLQGFNPVERAYLGTINASGTVSSSILPKNARGNELNVRSMVVIDDRAIMYDDGSKQLTWLLGPSTLTTVDVGTELYDLQRGSDTEFWAGRQDNQTISAFTKDGVSTGSFPAGGLPFAPIRFTVDPGGNVWAPQGSRGIVRILSGLVPTPTASPTITPDSGVVAGTALTARPGAWRYEATDFTYTWQTCASSDTSTCTDVVGAAKTNQYTTLAADDGKYVRVGVRAQNLNGLSEAAYSGLVQVGSAPTPAPPGPAPTPTPPAGTTAAIGNGVTMELDAPASQKRGKRAWYEVVFSATDTVGTVTYTIKKGSRTVTKSVTVQDGIAEYRWKAPRNWRKGRTTVTAVFTPAAGSPYTSAGVVSRVRIR